MFVVTFYSYKGGVGRTSALMNCAYRLAEMGKRVFVLDFDLEAPGVDSFELSQSNASRPGLVEYIARFMDSGEVAPLDEFVFDISPKNPRGSVLMMPAGRKDANYQASLSRLDWKFLYKQKSGFLFVENVKAAVREKYAPDYILIDSRTGLTDISGICTLQLPDLVVLLFSLNNQNVWGTAQIYNSIRFNKLNRPIKTLLVASPIPDVPESVEIRRARFENARKGIGSSPDLVLPFDAFMTFQETIAVGNQSHALTKGYDELTGLVIGSNASDPLTLLREARRLTDVGNAELAELKYREVVEARPDSWEAWTNFGIFQKTRGRLEDALECFRRALEVEPNSMRAVGQMSSTALDLNRIDEAKRYAKRLIESGNDPNELTQLGGLFQRRGLPEIAYGAYRKAAEIAPGWDTLLSWGEASMALKLYEEAFNTYRRALQEQPSNLAGVFNAAYAAKALGRPEAGDLFLKAIELFEHQEGSGRGRAGDPNGSAAMASAYVAVNRPEKALRLLRNARRLAESSEIPVIFSPSVYTYVARKEFLDEVDTRIKDIEGEHKEAADAAVPTILTAIKAHEKYIITFKRGEQTRRHVVSGLGAATTIFKRAGMDATSIERYTDMLSRSRPVHVPVDADPESVFDSDE